MSKPITPARCLICRAPAEVNWPVRNNPHCWKCCIEARDFVIESETRIPKFGAPTAEELLGHVRAAFEVTR